MLQQRHHSNHLGPMLHTAGPLVPHMVSLVLHPLQLSSLDLLEQEVKISSCQCLLVSVPTHYVLRLNATNVHVADISNFKVDTNQLFAYK